FDRRTERAQRELTTADMFGARACLGAVLRGASRRLGAGTCSRPFFVCRVTFVDRRLGHRDQLLHERIELLKFLRWTAHVVSMIAPMLLVTVALAQEPAKSEKADRDQGETNETDFPGVPRVKSDEHPAPQQNHKEDPLKAFNDFVYAPIEWTRVLAIV